MKEEAEVQGASQEKKLKEASEDLIHVLGEDSPSAAEVNKQVEEVDSVRQSLVNDIGTRIEKASVYVSHIYGDFSTLSEPELFGQI